MTCSNDPLLPLSYISRQRLQCSDCGRWVEFAGWPLTAITCRWIFCSIAAIHFPQRSEAAIGLRVINF
jgi:hypothetical protein